MANEVLESSNTSVYCTKTPKRDGNCQRTKKGPFQKILQSVIIAWRSKQFSYVATFSAKQTSHVDALQNAVVNSGNSVQKHPGSIRVCIHMLASSINKYGSVGKHVGSHPYTIHIYIQNAP